MIGWDMEVALKTRNMPMLAAYLCGHVAVFLVVAGRDPAPVLQLDWKTGGTLAVLTMVVSFVVSEALSDNAKARLVFWRWHNPLPGCAAFSQYMHEDDRIDPVVLQSRLGTLPTDPAQQNSVWYRSIYKPHRDVPSVVQAHGRYLMFRDMATMSVVVSLAALMVVLALPVPPVWKAGYGAVLVLQHALINLSAVNLGVRLVKNALAEACA